MALTNDLYHLRDVAHFLLIYDRSAGRLLRQTEFATDVEALDARFAAEAEYGMASGIEILAVSAASETALRESHGRYFLSSEQLGQRLVGAKR